MTCTNPNHDHWQPTRVADELGLDWSGDEVRYFDNEAHVPSRCPDCREPQHYDLRADLYRHDEAEPCWLTLGPDAASPCTP